MFKNLFICFALLFAQLAALHYLDNRLNGASTEVRQASTPPPVAQRDEEEDNEKNDTV